MRNNAGTASYEVGEQLFIFFPLPHRRWGAGGGGGPWTLAPMQQIRAKKELRKKTLYAQGEGRGGALPVHAHPVFALVATACKQGGMAGGEGWPRGEGRRRNCSTWFSKNVARCRRREFFT